MGGVVFPGTNCEMDTVDALEALGGIARTLWHADDDLPGIAAVVVPGGFAHGDSLRPGAIARFSPIMVAIARFAAGGGPVGGVGNGFQVLTEAGLLPGALQKNQGLKFLCQPARLRVETPASVLTRRANIGMELEVPINHFEGNFTCDDETLARLVGEAQVVLRYVENPNGSVDDIAAICNEGRNVVGLMPHPERACNPLLGSEDGRVLISSLLAAVA